MSELNQNKSFNYSSFSEFCFHKGELPPETRHTVEVLLDIACDDYEEAENVLLNETVLDLECCEISDLSPLATLPNLTCLYLSENNISDLIPLQRLTNLRRIELHQNKIRDITPLQKLVHVDELTLSDNYISDISPLSKLNKLIQLWLDNNQIINIKPLSKLINVEEIHLYKNQIIDIKPLGRLTNLQYLDLGDNNIEDITPLEKLIKLEYLNLEENKIVDISPLHQLENLGQLYLSKNKISNLNAIFSLEKLYVLEAGFNQIRDFNSLQVFKNINLNVSGNPFSGLVSPNYLIEKYKRSLYLPINHQEAIEAVTLTYSNLSLEAPKVMITSNYKSFHAQAFNLLESKIKIKYSDLIAFVHNIEDEEQDKIRDLIDNANKNIFQIQDCKWTQIVIKRLIQFEFNNSQFIRQLQSISQLIQFYLSPEELSLGNYIVTTQDILYQIYLIEVYQSLLKIPLDEKTQQWYDCLNQLFEHCGWFIPFEDVCIVCVKRSSTEGNRPSKFSLDSENRLHAEGEPAIQFADGYGLYYYHGVAQPYL